VGETLVLTFRLPSSVDADCANPIVTDNTVAPTPASTIFVRLDLIDTTPPVNGRKPTAEKARRWPALESSNDGYLAEQAGSQTQRSSVVSHPRHLGTI
jgi:hypothetical protein